MKLLMLTGKFGMGHYSAAVSLAERIAKVNPETEIVIRDIFEYAMPSFSGKVYHTFETIVTQYSRVYNRYYNHLERKGPNLRPVFLSYFLKKVKELMEEEQPAAVISTLPLCSQIMSRYKAANKSTVLLITCITDISSHSEWINECTDCYLVPDRMIRASLMQKGVEGGLIYVYGIPVRPEFDRTAGDFPECASDHWSKKNILIMGGGLGILPDSEEFYEELNRSEQVRVTVITGKNREIYQKLYGKYENIEVVGYTHEVYRYMQEADVVISKPGGITLFETIHTGTPILVFEPFLQQEINNTGFIVRRGIGMILEKDPAACVREIGWIMENDGLLNTMRTNVECLKREYDQTAIRKVLSLISDNGPAQQPVPAV